jgi:hypothetical protein
LTGEPEPVAVVPTAENQNLSAEPVETSAGEPAPASAEEKPNSEAKKEDGFEIDNPLFSGNINPGEKAAELKIENLESLTPLLKEYGIEDVSKLPETLKSYSEVKEEMATLTPMVENVKNLFASMPAELYKAVDMFTKGEDWRGSLGIKGINYETPIEKVDSKELVENYFPGQVSADEWEEYNDPDGDTNLKRFVDNLKEQGKNLFKEKQNGVLSYRDSQVQSQKAFQEQYAVSIDASKAELKKSFPIAKDSYIEDVAKRATQESVLALFFEKDGTLRPDGLTRFSLAEQGKGLVDSLLARAKTKIERDTETRVNQERLATSANVPNVNTGSSGDKVVVSPEVQKKIEEMRELAG